MHKYQAARSGSLTNISRPSTMVIYISCTTWCYRPSGHTRWDVNQVTTLLRYPIMITLLQNQNEPGYKHLRSRHITCFSAINARALINVHFRQSRMAPSHRSLFSYLLLLLLRYYMYSPHYTLSILYPNIIILSMLHYGYNVHY